MECFLFLKMIKASVNSLIKLLVFGNSLKKSGPFLFVIPFFRIERLLVVFILFLID